MRGWVIGWVKGGVLAGVMVGCERLDLLVAGCVREEGVRGDVSSFSGGGKDDGG